MADRVASSEWNVQIFDLALSEFVRRARAGKILDLAGSGLWEEDPAEMRRDTQPKTKKKGPRAAA